MNPNYPWNSYSHEQFLNSSTGNVQPDCTQPPMYCPNESYGGWFTQQSLQPNIQPQPETPSLFSGFYQFTPPNQYEPSLPTKPQSQELKTNVYSCCGTKNEQHPRNELGGTVFSNKSFANPQRAANLQNCTPNLFNGTAMISSLPSRVHPVLQDQNRVSTLQSSFFREDPRSLLENQLRQLLRLSSSENASAKNELHTTHYNYNPFNNRGTNYGAIPRASINNQKAEDYSELWQRNQDHETMAEWKNSTRYWKYFDKKREKSSRAMEISVMSYNILAQSLLEDNSYLYNNCCRDYLDWSFRGPALMKQFEHHKSDIICLQEVQEDHWLSFFQPQLKYIGYEGFFVKRTGDKQDGCAILFRHKKFKLIEFVPVSFQRGGVLDRDNVGIILLLKPRKKYYRSCTPKICVATTHILFNPRRGDVKLAQLMLFLAEIEKHSFLNTQNTKSESTASENATRSPTNHPYCPVIFCGDMNLEPKSYLHDFLIKGHINYDSCISQLLSGQGESFSRSHVKVATHLLPEHLGINDHCQFMNDVCKRLPMGVPSASLASDLQNLESSQTEPGGIGKNAVDESSQPEVGQTIIPTPSDKSDRRTLMNTGHAYHNFNFKSVYPHNSNLVTTHHGRASCMVDYIFYSSGQTVQSKGNAKCDTERREKKMSNKYEVKTKRKRTESTNSDKQNSSFSLPYKTLRGECEHVASILSNLKKQKQSEIVKDIEQKMQSVYENSVSQISSTTLAIRGDRHSPEPGEVLSSDSLLGNEEEKAMDSFSDVTSLVSKSSAAEIDPVKCNDNKPIDSKKYSNYIDKGRSIQTLELVGYWSLLSSRDFKRIGSLPNKIFPSDHICLIAKFRLN